MASNEKQLPALLLVAHKVYKNRNDMDKNYVLVYTTSGRLNGDMIRIYLESGGLNPLVYQESAGMTYGLTIGPLSEVKIMVPEEQVEIAADMLGKMERGEVTLEPLDDEGNENIK
jgi:hypothetical protein